jgi:sugar phosphate isomerase/epimerase
MHPSTKSLNRRVLISTGMGVTALSLAACGVIEPIHRQQTATRRVLWAANVRNKSLAERIQAAQIGGFTHMSVFPIDYRTWRAQGMSVTQMQAMLRQANIRVLAIDPFVQWTPNFTIPPGYPADYRGFIDFTESQIFEIAADLGAEAINCVEGLGQQHALTELTSRFGAFADRAQARGLRVTLEFMPISSIPDLAAGWAIVDGAKRPNAGMCFDTWHYYRSTPNDALLRTIPGSRIFEVQLADALAKLQGQNLTEDLLRFRRLPGEGELPIAQAIAILRSIGAWRSVGPEVFSDAMDALGATAVGKRAGASMDQWI